MLNKRKKIRSVGGIKKKCIFAADFPSGSSSVGRAQPCQGWGREFESRFPLKCRDDVRIVSTCFKRKNQHLRLIIPLFCQENNL